MQQADRYSGLRREEDLTPLVGARVLVTGGAGAIGNNLVRQLVRIGSKVVVVDDYSFGRSDNLADLFNEIDFIQGDIADETTLSKAFSTSVDFVFHLAALFANQNSVEHPIRDLNTNGFGTLRLLENAVYSGVQRFIFSSSSCVYGESSEVMSEDMPNLPDTPYAITKLLGEQYSQFFSKHNGLSTTVVRYFNSFGPGEYAGRFRNVVPNFFDLAAKGMTLPITGTGLETRDFTFVEDIVRGTLFASVVAAADGEIFNLGTGRRTQIGNLAEKINQITGNQAGTRIIPRRTWDKVSHRRACINKARDLLGYEPMIDLDEGLHRYWSWYKRVGDKQRSSVG